MEFSTALNPMYGSPGQSMQRLSRPSSLSTAPSTVDVNDLPITARGGDSSTSAKAHQSRQRAVSVSDFGLSVTFTAPEIAQVGTPCSWDVLVLNRSNNPRQLAFSVIPKRKRGIDKGNVAQNYTAPLGERRGSGTSEAVIDESLLLGMQRNARSEAAQVICLTTDLRVG